MKFSIYLFIPFSQSSNLNWQYNYTIRFDFFEQFSLSFRVSIDFLKYLQCSKLLSNFIVGKHACPLKDEKI